MNEMKRFASSYNAIRGRLRSPCMAAYEKTPRSVRHLFDVNNVVQFNTKGERDVTRMKTSVLSYLLVPHSHARTHDPLYLFMTFRTLWSFISRDDESENVCDFLGFAACRYTLKLMKLTCLCFPSLYKLDFRDRVRYLGDYSGIAFFARV